MRLQYPHVVSSLALFVAIGGTAAAVDGPNPGQNTIGSEDIIGNEIKSDDLGNGRIFNLDIADEIITGQKIKNDSLTADDINEATLPQPTGVIDVAPAQATNNCFQNPPPTTQFCRGTQTTGAGTQPRQWSNYGEGYAPAAVWKDETGFVHLQGSVKSDGSATFDQLTPIFILSPSYRPSTTRAFPLTKESTPGNIVAGWLLVQDNGWVFFTPGSGSVVRYLSLDGVTFRP